MVPGCRRFATIEAVARDGEGVRVALGESERRALRGLHFLVAAGRQPHTDDLGLEATAIETDDRGYIQVDDHLRTSIEGVFALGDCNGRGALTHTSYNDYDPGGQTCSTATTASSPTASRPTPRSSTRRSPASGRARRSCATPG